MGRLGLAMLVIAGCMGDALVPCGDALCPAGDICDPIHGGCLTPEQATSCIGQPDAVQCVAGDVGYCLDQICIVPGCGNHVLDVGEQCDDGNTIGGDGCSANCTSTELCRNGVLDATLGETCDDGNAMNHDGCDSRCQIETSTWTLEGMSPHLGYGGYAHPIPYDTVHDRPLHLAADLDFTFGAGSTVGAVLWTWNGDRWTVVSGSGPFLPSNATYAFDEARGTFVAVAGFRDVSGNAVPLSLLAEWDGASWTEHPMQGAPALAQFEGAYDIAHDRVVIAGVPDFLGALGRQAWALDVATGDWTQLPPPGGSSFVRSVVYDEARNRIVVVGLDGDVVDWDGTSWTVHAGSLGSGYASIIATYDPAEHAVVAYAGDAVTSVVAKLTASGWVALPPIPVQIYGLGLTYDRGRQRLVVIGGADGEQIVEWDGAAWHVGTSNAPPTMTEDHHRIDYTYDDANDRLVMSGLAGTEGTNVYEIWARPSSGTWHQIDTSSLPGRFETGLAYDPVRRAVVMTARDLGTWLLVGDQFLQLEAPGAGKGRDARAMAYDAAGRRMIAIDGSGTYALPSDGATWTRIATNDDVSHPYSGQPSLAFDARNGQMVLQANGLTYKLDGTTWTLTLSTLDPYLVADTRRGSVDLSNGLANIWERYGADWRELDAVPLLLRALGVYASRSSELLVIGHVAQSWLIARRHFTGTGPEETCVPGEDADGDGLAGCDDPDCWLDCHPTCPPYASCP